jgi:hypothetical protein
MFDKNGLADLQRYVDTGKMPGEADVLPYSEDTWARMVDGSLANA